VKIEVILAYAMNLVQIAAGRRETRSLPDAVREVKNALKEANKA
jgi:hypothetical protein